MFHPYFDFPFTIDLVFVPEFETIQKKLPLFKTGGNCCLVIVATCVSCSIYLLTILLY